MSSLSLSGKSIACLVFIDELMTNVLVGMCLHSVQFNWHRLIGFL